MSLDQFCRDDSIRVKEGIKTGLIKPMGRREVELRISGLNINTPDSLVVDYISKHGRVVHPKVIYDTDKEGPLKGLKNGDRRYLVDFTNGRNMGSFHILDGATIKVHYSGQKKTCGRCHSTASSCPGGGIARSCELNHGTKVSLVDHMKKYWDEIGFNPVDFKLDDVEDEEAEECINDLPIKDNDRFTPNHKKPTNNLPENSHYSGLTLKNFPANISETDLHAFLVSMGLPKDYSQLKLKRSERNTAVDINDLENVTCLKLIKCLHEKNFFNRTIFCRGVCNLFSPSKGNSASEG